MHRSWAQAYVRDNIKKEKKKEKKRLPLHLIKEDQAPQSDCLVYTGTDYTVVRVVVYQLRNLRGHM